MLCTLALPLFQPKFPLLCIRIAFLHGIHQKKKMFDNFNTRTFIQMNELREFWGNKCSTHLGHTEVVRVRVIKSMELKHKSISLRLVQQNFWMFFSKSKFKHESNESTHTPELFVRTAMPLELHTIGSMANKWQWNLNKISINSSQNSGNAHSILSRIGWLNVR